MICPKPYDARQVVAARMIVMTNGVQILFPSQQESAVTGTHEAEVVATTYKTSPPSSSAKHDAKDGRTRPHNRRSIHEGWRWYFPHSKSWKSIYLLLWCLWGGEDGHGTNISWSYISSLQHSLPPSQLSSAFLSPFGPPCLLSSNHSLPFHWTFNLPHKSFIVHKALSGIVTSFLFSFSSSLYSFFPFFDVLYFYSLLFPPFL